MKQGSSRWRLTGVWIGIAFGVIIFAGWLLVRTFAFASYKVPTGAMEKTIHVGGKVLVKKFNYLPINREDIIVFHFPIGDTVINLPEYQSMRPYYDVIRELGRGNADSGRQIVLSNPTDYPLSIRPVSRRETYLKRCNAIAGDTLEIRDEVLYINGRPQAWPPGAVSNFHVVTKGQPLDEEIMKTKYGIDMTNGEEVRALENPREYDMLLTWEAREKMLKDGFALKISPDIDANEDVWPYDQRLHWTRDNYGPLRIPKKGASIQLTALNYPLYERVIRTYEGNKLDMRDDKIYINDKEAASYTFKMNYYWTIGDNLHGSQDSRYWGFVPEDHLIGKVTTIL